MKRPKQQTGPLSFLNFFSRKPKSEPRAERPVEACPKEEVAITLTPSEHPEQVRLMLRLLGVSVSNEGVLYLGLYKFWYSMVEYYGIYVYHFEICVYF